MNIALLESFFFISNDDYSTLFGCISVFNVYAKRSLSCNQSSYATGCFTKALPMRRNIKYHLQVTRNICTCTFRKALTVIKTTNYQRKIGSILRKVSLIFV